MADILPTTFWNALLNANDNIVMQISLKFVPKGPVSNKAALIHVMP